MNEHYEQELRERKIQALERIADALETANAIEVANALPLSEMTAALIADTRKVALTKFKPLADAIPTPQPKTNIKLS